MILIVISSSPVIDNLYEQGIETALNLADAEIEVSVLIEGEFLNCVEANPQCTGAKKLGQCKLYEVSVYSQSKVDLAFVKAIDTANLQQHASKIVVF